MARAAEEVPDELLEAGSQAKKQGKIRFFGVSTHDLNLMADHFVKAGNIDAVTFTYNFTMARKGRGHRQIEQGGNRLTAMKVMAAYGGGLPKMPRAGRAAADGPRQCPPRAQVGAAKPHGGHHHSGRPDMEMLELNIRALSEKFAAEDEKRLVARSEAIRPTTAACAIAAAASVPRACRCRTSFASWPTRIFTGFPWPRGVLPPCRKR